MTPLVFMLATLATSFVAGALGSIVGLGGGIVVIPFLTLALHVNIRYAIGASIVSVIATSSGAASAYVREHLSNLRVAMFLELGTTAGAITGALLSGHIPTRWLFIVFGAVLGCSAVAMLHKQQESAPSAVPPDRWADRLALHGTYHDHHTGQVLAYRVTASRLGLALMYVAGMVSGLLGIGSGALKVTAMDLVMRLPIKVSTATSNLMIGVTAAASAGFYFVRGDIDPFITAPVALGVLAGAVVGARAFPRLRNRAIRIVFVVALCVIAVQMLLKGVRTA